LAAELVLSQLSGATVAPGRYVVPSSYVQRESCGCLPAGHAATAHDRPGAGDAVERFTQSIVAADLSHGPATELTVRNLALQVHDIYLDAAQREPTASSLMRLSQICEDIYWHHPARSTFDAIESLALQLSSELQAALGELPPGAGERLDHCTAQVRLSLNKALLDVRNNSYYELRKAIRNEYHITLDLLNNHDKDPRLLEWMRHTEARLGVLALWQHERPEQGPAAKALTAPDEPPLDIVGTFDASGQHLELPSNTTNVGSFPPLTLLDTQGDPSFVCVFPVKSPVRDWGFLAIAQPAGDRLDQEAYFTWSALFSEAMDYRALLRSLQQKSEDLALSYERERDMAQTIRESEERYALAARAANDGLWDWDLSKGTIYYSSRWKQMLGFAEDEITSSPDEWLRRAHHDDRALLISELEDLKRGRSASIMNEHRVLARDGTYIWVLCRGLAVPGEGRPATRVVGSFTDVTQRRALEDRLRRQALYDSLTGLANRLLFLDRLSQAMASAKRRAGWSYTVLWLDLDNFKQLNDSLGHLYGDKLLVQVAERIRAHIRETDTASRFGGDEFVLLLQDADDPKSLEAVVRRLSERLNEPYDLDGQVVTVTASIGVAISTAGYERPEEVLRDADLAMYRAKAMGRGTYVKFNSALSSAPGR
jgi:diguanylate cyclase (GGDEF)-like protein/PAS domain S-box-containing protein